ncbi:MAG: helix-turn-helix transcriptional regulator [Candidatus Delongbacteria bacterium]|nr:helix-turn-helix transcriptional regulator [Candidatus Delongbacteria bacterium]
MKKARKESGLSQEELAKKVGISRMMISRYEVGSSNMSLKQLRKVSKVFKKPISFFFNEEESEDSGKVWKEAQKYLELFKGKIGDKLNLSPKEMLAFSLNNTKDTQKAIEEAKTLMRNWYIAHNMQNITNKSFEEWWENSK